VTTLLEERLATRGRLQAVEDDLMAAAKRNVTIEGAAGVFTWVLRGAGREPAEPMTFVDDIQEVEDMILVAGLDEVLEMTQHGTFTWARNAN
jgi:hypothetical protein